MVISFAALVDKLINTTNKEENQVLINKMEINKDEIYEEDEYDKFVISTHKCVNLDDTVNVIQSDLT